MDKYITVKLSDKELNLSYNIAGMTELSRLLALDDPTPENIGKEIMRMGTEDPMNLMRALVYSGVYGYSFEFTNNIRPPYQLKEIGMMVLTSSNEEAKELMQKVMSSLGFDLKVEQDDTKKKTTKKK